MLDCHRNLLGKLSQSVIERLEKKKTWPTDTWDRNTRESHGGFKIFDAVSYWCH